MKVSRGIVVLAWCGLLVLTAACNAGRQRRQQPPSEEQLLELNRQKVAAERNGLDAYIARAGWKMEESPTGLRYDVYHRGAGEAAEVGDRVRITYKLYLLDSTLVDSAGSAQPLEFELGKADVATGLHEAVALLREGDSARFILPSHLAYGLTGSKDVPGNAALIYDLSLLEVF